MTCGYIVLKEKDWKQNEGVIVMKTSQRIMFFLVMAAILVVTSPAFASDIRTEVQYYVNVERINAGLTPVVLDDSIGRGAVVRATEAQVSFAHQRPDGRDVKSVLENGTCGWFGENLAVSEVKDARRIVRAWMGSPTHRANILGRHYVRMGVECIRNKADGHYYWALLFAGE